MGLFLISVAIFGCSLSCVLWVSTTFQEKNSQMTVKLYTLNLSYVQVCLYIHVCEQAYVFAYVMWGRGKIEQRSKWMVGVLILSHYQDISCFKSQRHNSWLLQAVVWRYFLYFSRFFPDLLHFLQ